MWNHLTWTPRNFDNQLNRLKFIVTKFFYPVDLDFLVKYKQDRKSKLVPFESRMISSNLLKHFE